MRDIIYDPQIDVLTVSGRRFSGSFFDAFAKSDPTKLYRFTEDKYGVIEIEVVEAITGS